MIMQVYPCCSCNRRRSWRSRGCCSQMLVRNRETMQLEKERKKWRKLEKASREIGNKMKKKKKERKKKTGKKKNNFHWGQAVGCSVACLGSLTIWLIKFSKPQTNHSKTLIKCVKKIVYYFIKIKLFVYNSTPIFSFLPFPVILSSVLLSSYSFSTSTMCFYVPSIPGVESHLKIWN